MSPPPPQPTVVDENANEDDAPEVENKVRGPCTAIPYIPKPDPNAIIPEGAGGAVLLKEEHLWDNGSTITYSFMPRVSTRKEWREDKVHKIIKEWSLYANITFEYIPNVKDADVRIAFEGSTSWALTGRKLTKDRTSTKPNMNLGGVYAISKTQLVDVGVILHEFGHVLGLEHEHQNPLLHDVYRLNEQYTKEAFMKDHGWTEKQVQEQIIDIFNSDDIGNYTDVDLKSVMMYFMPAAQNDKGLEIPPNNALSDYDKAFMLIHYPYFGFEPQVEGWDFTKALDVFGIQGSDRQEMLDLYGTGNVRDVRRQFGQVYASIRAERNAALARDVASRPPAPPAVDE